MVDEPERGRDSSNTIGGAVLILAVGAALGIGWNAMGLVSLPVRGLPWIAHPPVTPRLESLQPAPDRGALAGTMAAPAPRAVSTSRPDSSVAGVKRAAAPRATSPIPAPAHVATAPPQHAAAPGGAPAPAADMPQTPAAAPATPAAGLPVIPDVGGPLTVELSAFKRLFDAGAALVVDAREPSIYEMGHIAGAINLPYNDALADRGRVERLDPGPRPLVVYCSGGTCELSLDLAKFLVDAGKRKVLVYEGGYHEWQVAGYPIERGPAAGAHP